MAGTSRRGNIGAVILITYENNSLKRGCQEKKFSLATMVGERIKQIRIRLGLTQKAFAQSLNTSAGFVSEVEQGKKMPGGEILSSLKRIYGADLNWVLSADDRIEETGIVSLSVRDTQAGCLEPDLSEFLSLPLYELDVAAGGGAEISRENVVTTLAFRRDWLAHEGLHSSKLVLVRVAGDSMEPTIADGGTILIDQAQTQIKNEKIFVFRYEDEGFVKRMRKAGDRAIVVSDNRSYPDWDAPLAELAIIGRVVWAARKVP